MTFAEYQDLAMRTKNRGDKVEIQAPGLCIAALGLVGEAGEAADLVKKTYGHGKPLNVDKLIDELGDNLWYQASIADELGISLDEVARRNVDKLKARYPEGFTTKRADVDV